MDTGTILLVSVALLALGMWALRRSFLFGQTIFILGILGLIGAVPAIGEFANTVVYGIAAGTTTFIQSF
ncbi:hypothetical protein K3N28_05180 [Glycomyces sp. TRM65418]|uniref:hypothetical protein n=1 Tax=Glycomyces sp. TRM65418 TaxID=2867006 RepID=UPI001CE70F19|nr:hypothetical protein [Glycomyces sp. TRM65418]MCC3762461.1 hypothetical protein [Glycomyces sp. TRM65418]QZD56505.1 hypothetical protein K3N28_05140 [Glycomyces sp. TRM65418]